MKLKNYLKIKNYKIKNFQERTPIDERIPTISAEGNVTKLSFI